MSLIEELPNYSHFESDKAHIHGRHILTQNGQTPVQQ